MLAEKTIKKYWARRAKAQGVRTVGFNNLPIDEQDTNYDLRKRFIFEYCPRDLKTLDYGCGIGRYAGEFDQYVGVDVTRRLIKLARKEFPDKRFIRLKRPYLGRNLDLDFDLFFTATVLQHCSDDVVDKIFRSAAYFKETWILFCLYENAQVFKEHVKGRGTDEYVALVLRYFNVADCRSYSHIIHGEEHTLSLIRV